MKREHAPDDSRNGEPRAPHPEQDAEGILYEDIVPKNMRPLEDRAVEGLQPEPARPISYDFGEDGFGEAPPSDRMPGDKPVTRSDRHRQTDPPSARGRYTGTLGSSGHVASADRIPTFRPGGSGPSGKGPRRTRLIRLIAVIVGIVLLGVTAAFAIPRLGDRIAAEAGTSASPGSSVSPGASASSGASVSPGASASASALPSITPTPTPVPGGVADFDTILDGDLVKIANNAQIVVVGQFTEYKGIWNAARDRDDITKEDTKNYIGEKQYVFSVVSVYQGSDLVKKNTQIVVTIPYESKMATWDATEKEEAFLEPVLNQDMMIFLKKDRDFDIWYPDTDPWSFFLRSDMLLVRSYRETTVAKWSGLYPNGIPLGDFKEALGLN